MKYGFIILIFISVNILFSQENNEPYIKHEICFDSYNIYRPLHDYIKGEPNDYYIHFPYELMYKRIYNKYSLVFSFGGLYASSDSYGGGDLIGNIDKYIIDFSIGVDKNIIINKRLDFYYGVSLFYNHYYEDVQFYRSDQLTFDGESQNSHYGISVLCGFQYNISNHFSLLTTTRFRGYYTYAKYDESSTCVSGPRKGTYQSFDAGYWSPIRLFVCYRF